MPGKIPQPWFRESKGAWFVCVGGKQHRLGKDRDEAVRRFHLLMAGEPLTPSHSKAGATTGENGGERQEAITAKETPCPSLTVNALADAYLTTCERRLSANPLRVARMFLGSFASAFGTKRADAVKKADVEAWVAKHPTWGQSTENAGKTRLVAMFRWGVEEGVLTFNPIAGIRKPSQRSWGREALISVEDHARLMAGATPALRNVPFALHESGARPGEVASVSAAEFFAQQGVWVLERHKTAHKTRKPRIIYLTPELVALCEELARKNPQGPLFRTSKGKPGGWCSIAKQVRVLRLRLGIKGATPYGYRHGYATDALANGVPDAHVAELLGHSGTAMLHKHYSHLTARAKALRDALGRVR